MMITGKAIDVVTLIYQMNGDYPSRFVCKPSKIIGMAISDTLPKNSDIKFRLCVNKKKRTAKIHLYTTTRIFSSTDIDYLIPSIRTAVAKVV